MSYALPLIFVSIPKRVSEALKPKLDGGSYAEVHVSIPKRVSEALKRFSEWHLGGKRNVSIPKRVSEALKPALSQSSARLQPFQSLKGFQRL